MDKFDDWKTQWFACCMTVITIIVLAVVFWGGVWKLVEFANTYIGGGY